MNQTVVALNAVLEVMALFRILGGNVQELLGAMSRAEEEGRDLTPEELAQLRQRAQSAVNRL